MWRSTIDESVCVFSHAQSPIYIHNQRVLNLPKLHEFEYFLLDKDHFGLI